MAPGLADRHDAPTMIQFAFDTRGRLSTQTKEDGSVLAYAYDGAGRLIRIDVTRAAGVEGTTVQEFAYDGQGRRVHANGVTLIHNIIGT